jgi:methyl-accepting chemotaxis protein
VSSPVERDARGWGSLMSRRSISWTMILPIPILAGTAVAAAWLFLPPRIEENVRTSAALAAEQTANQFKTIRSYYTSNVVSKVLASGAMKTSVDHKSDAAAIPLPATFIHHVSKLLAETNTTVNLVSPYPFPNRKDRKLDAFQSAAWEALTKNPDAGFVRQETRDGKQVVRVAVADRLTADTCVKCHNSHPASPKTDWKLGDVRGVLEVANVIDDQLAAGATLSRTIIAGMIGAAILLVLISSIVTRRAIRPLESMAQAMKRLAAGETDIDISAADRRDEIGEMAKAVQIFKDAAVEKRRVEAEAIEIRQGAEAARSRTELEKARDAKEDQAAVAALAAGLASLARGELTHRIDVDFAPKTEQLKTDFNRAMAHLHETVATIAAAIGAIKAGTGEISQAADNLSRRTEQQAASLEETAASLNSITDTVTRTAEGARQAARVSGAAKTSAETSGSVVREAAAAMVKIENSSKKISQIIGVIDEIAFQTNLLALNAGVEAARAGEAGRGFAVVASEVRALAQRSAEAAKEIKGLILASTTQVDQGVGLVDKTGEVLQLIVTQVMEMSGLVESIASSAGEQSTGLAEVNAAVNTMDEVTQRNAAMVKDTTEASHALAQEADELARLIQRFKLSGTPAAAGDPAASRKRPAASDAHIVKLKPAAGRGQPAAARRAAAEAESWDEF